MTIAVLTAALPSRLHLLAECVASIQAQTLQPVTHTIGIDYQRVGCARMMNELYHTTVATEADYVALLADDDIAYPHHLETLMQSDADVIYTWCDVEGRNWSPNSHFDPDRLERENYIPSTTAIRTELVDALDGWREDAEAANGWEDWDFWRRAWDAGARFECIPEITWKYRFHGANLSMGEI